MATAKNIFILVMLLLLVVMLMDKCNTPVIEPEPGKTVYIKGETVVKRDTIIVEVKAKAPKADTVYLSSTITVPCDDHIREYPVNQSDTSGSITGRIMVKGHLLGFNLLRSCINTHSHRTDIEQQEKEKPQRNKILIGAYAGIHAQQFTYGITGTYQNKRNDAITVGVNPIDKSGFIMFCKPIGLKRKR